MQYVITGKLETPTPDQNERARLTGGWKEKTINGVDVLWNPCVSPPFGGGDKYKDIAGVAQG